MRPASHYRYVLDCEMVIMAKIRTEMRVINAAVFFHLLIVMLFLSSLIVMLVFVLVLSISGHRPTQKERSA